MGNLNAKRDWGHARDYVEMQWLMLQMPQPEDFVIATGQHYSVRQFIEKAAACLDIGIEWKGSAENEKGFTRDGHCIVAVDPGYYRPTEVETLLGDASKAREKLGWQAKTDFSELVEEMVRSDYELAERELRAAGTPRSLW
jgi:GDPmannose 4,6-dehydratase